MKGKVCLVTGATDGIGKVTVYALAQMGATVVGVGRNPEKIAAVLAEQKPAPGRLEFLQADQASLAQVRSLADAFKAKYQRLDVLINNAGASFPRYMESPDGIEMTFAVNHLSHFLLTTLLLDQLETSAPARIINVSSSAHRHAGLNLDRINRPAEYDAWAAYSASKFANILFTYELARRLKDKPVTVNALHPGFVNTHFFAAAEMNMRGGITPEQGARTQIWLASSDEVAGVTGKYFVDCRESKTIPESYDLELGRKLWEVSEALIEQAR